jgi:hypothetical protein
LALVIVSSIHFFLVSYGISSPETQHFLGWINTVSIGFSPEWGERKIYIQITRKALGVENPQDISSDLKLMYTSVRTEAAEQKHIAKDNEFAFWLEQVQQHKATEVSLMPSSVLPKRTPEDKEPVRRFSFFLSYELHL